MQCPRSRTATWIASEPVARETDHDKRYGNYTAQMILGGPTSLLYKRAQAEADSLNLGLAEYLRQTALHCLECCKEKSWDN
jgi:hypothetical protein